ncbi:hypothetical protein FRC06_001688, partial [Ceratobasidium sp. 370]
LRPWRLATIRATAPGLLAQLGLTKSENSLQNTIEGPGGEALCDLFESQGISLPVPKNDEYDPYHPSISDDPWSIWSYNTIFGTPEDGFKITSTSPSRRGASQSRSSGSSGLKWPGRSSRKRWNGLLDNNQVQAGLLDDVNEGFKSTVLAPTDQAFYDANLSDDKCPSVMKNHFFVGAIVYSTLFTKIPEAAAEPGKKL